MVYGEWLRVEGRGSVIRISKSIQRCKRRFRI